MASGRNQHDFAVAIDYNASHVSRVERGQATPSREFVDACEVVLTARGRLIILYAVVLSDQKAYRMQLRGRGLGLTAPIASS